MFRRVWQTSMIWMARSPTVKRFMQSNRATSFIVDKYVGGDTPEAGIERVQALLTSHGIRSSMYYLGEYVDTEELVAENVENKTRVASLLGDADLEIHVSVDPTQIGLQLDQGLAEGNALLLANTIREAVGNHKGFHCLMLDMEDASVNDATIALHDELQRQGFPVALTLQAYLKRTMSDMHRQVQLGSRIRLVKGAFAASADIAFTRHADIKKNTRQLIDLMLSREAQETGFYPIIATHDEKIHAHALKVARQNGWAPGEYEFEMLLGVCSDLAEQLAENGERVRLYVPFGRDWWPHAVRRIGENPANALLLLRSLIN